jgi:hypothetical protein
MLLEVVQPIVDLVALCTAWYSTTIDMVMFLAVHSSNVAKAIMSKAESLGRGQ